jgi:hypothetical protein
MNRRSMLKRLGVWGTTLALHPGRFAHASIEPVVGLRNKSMRRPRPPSTMRRDKSVAMRQLEESLRRLRTDYLELRQIHEVDGKFELFKWSNRYGGPIRRKQHWESRLTEYPLVQ